MNENYQINNDKINNRRVNNKKMDISTKKSELSENYVVDNLDKEILNHLLINARTPYAELAKMFAVSAGTIHVRIEKMRQAGIILGTQLQVDSKKLGYDVCCFIGITLKHAKDYPATVEKLKLINEVLEVYYTTGQYSIFIKILTRSIDDLHRVLIYKIQNIEEVQSTETLISLENPIQRNIADMLMVE